MKLKTITTVEACRSALSPRRRWCSHCRRNEHHRCTGSRLCNHGVTEACECPHRDSHNQSPAVGTDPAAGCFKEITEYRPVLRRSHLTADPSSAISTVTPA